MSDHIARQKLLAAIIDERDKEALLRANARHHRHYEECNMHNHAVQVLNKIILLVRGMEAEDAETETD